MRPSNEPPAAERIPTGRHPAIELPTGPSSAQSTPTPIVVKAAAPVVVNSAVTPTPEPAADAESGDADEHGEERLDVVDRHDVTA